MGVLNKQMGNLFSKDDKHATVSRMLDTVIPIPNLRDLVIDFTRDFKGALVASVDFKRDFKTEYFFTNITWKPSIALLHDNIVAIIKHNGLVCCNINVNDLSTKKMIENMFGLHEAKHLVSMDDGLIAVTTYQTIHIWNVQTGSFICKYSCDELFATVSFGGHKIIKSSKGLNVCVLSVLHGKLFAQSIPVHSDVRSIAVISETMAAFGCDDCTIQLWDLFRNICFRIIRAPHPNDFPHKDGQWAVGLCVDDGDLRLELRNWRVFGCLARSTRFCESDHRIFWLTQNRSRIFKARPSRVGVGSAR